jgi:hypothetical protein
MSAERRIDRALSRNPKPPPFRRWRILIRAAVAAVGDHAGELVLDLREDSLERVAVPRVKPEDRLHGFQAAS